MSKKVKKAESYLIKLKPFDSLIPSLDIGQFEKQNSVFQELAAGVIYQQISIKAAASIYSKFCHYLGGNNYSAESILNSSHENLRLCGLSNQKANYVRNIASFFNENKLDSFDWEKHDDQAIINMLTAIKGVGEWTVQMLLMFYLERQDIFPVKDLGVQLAMKGIYDIDLEKKHWKRK